MPPFTSQPEGFSTGALKLLDDALTRLWLEQVAIGATLSGLEPVAVERLLQAGQTQPLALRAPQRRSSGKA